MQRIPFAMKPTRELSVTDSSFYRDSLMFTVQSYNLVEMFQRDKISRRVGNIVEGMTRAQRFQFVAMNEQFLDLFNCFRLVKLGSPIGVIASPIAWILDHLYVPLKRYETEFGMATLLNVLCMGAYSLYNTDKYTLRVEQQFLESFAKKECSVEMRLSLSGRSQRHFPIRLRGSLLLLPERDGDN